MADSRQRCEPHGFYKVLTGCVLTTVIYAASVLASTPPPVVDESISQSDVSWRAPAKPSSGMKMGGFRITFEETTLAQVMKATGLGTIQQHGDAAEHVLWLCYTAVTNGKTSRLWIESSGEMGGPEHDITEIGVQSIAKGPVPSDCPVVPQKFTKLSFDKGLWLGAPEDAVRKTFPVGLLQSDAHAFVGYDGKVPGDGKCQDGYDLLNSMYLIFEAGIVVAINAGQVTSC
jgi:hypothetical protein